MRVRGGSAGRTGPAASRDERSRNRLRTVPRSWSATARRAVSTSRHTSSSVRSSSSRNIIPMPLADRWTTKPGISTTRPPSGAGSSMRTIPQTLRTGRTTVAMNTPTATDVQGDAAGPGARPCIGSGPVCRPARAAPAYDRASSSILFKQMERSARQFAANTGSRAQRFNPLNIMNPQELGGLGRCRQASPAKTRYIPVPRARCFGPARGDAPSVRLRSRDGARRPVNRMLGQEPILQLPARGEASRSFARR